MQTTKIIHTVSCHAGGEVGDVIVGGVPVPPGDSIWAQARWLHADATLRNFVLNEPRGGVFRHVNLLVPPVHPDADIGWIIMEPAHTPPMSGSNSICVATVLLETGIVPMREPETKLTMEAPGGLVQVLARCKHGKVESVTVRNLPSFADRIEVTIDVPEIGKVTVDSAYGGDSFVLVDAGSLGFELQPNEARKLVEVGTRIIDAANAQMGFFHPDRPDWKHISFCQFTEPPRTKGGILVAKNAVVIEPGKVDRSPTGTGMSARMAVLHAKGEMQVGDSLHSESIIGSCFQGRIVGVDQVGDRQAIIPEITGKAWITGTHQHTLDPTDPWPEGYRISDTWPMPAKNNSGAEQDAIGKG